MSEPVVIIAQRTDTFHETNFDSAVHEAAALARNDWIIISIGSKIIKRYCRTHDKFVFDDKESNDRFASCNCGE